MYFPHVAKREGNKKMQKVAEFVVFVGCTWQICSSCGKIDPSSVVCPKNYSQFCRTPQTQVPIFRPSDGVRGHSSGCVGRLRAKEHRVVADTAEQVGRLRWEMSLKIQRYAVHWCLSFFSRRGPGELSRSGRASGTVDRRNSQNPGLWWFGRGAHGSGGACRQTIRRTGDRKSVV